MDGRKIDSALQHYRWIGMGNPSRKRLRDAGTSALQRKGRARQTDVEGYGEAELGRRYKTGRPRSPGRQDDVHHLSYLVDDELRRLSSAHSGQLEERTPALRGRRDAQLRHLQSPG